MPIDSSIYNNVKPPAPLDIGGLLNTANSALQFQGQQAVGDVYKQSTGPEGVDFGKLGILGGQQGGVAAPALVRQSQEGQQRQQTISAQKMQNAQARKTLIAQDLYSHIGDEDLSGPKLMETAISYLGHDAFDDIGYSPTGVVGLDQEFRDKVTGKYLDQPKLREKIAQYYISTLDPKDGAELVPYGTNADGTARHVPRAMAILDYARKFSSNPNAVAPPHAGAGPRAAPSSRAAQYPGGVTVPSVTSGLPLGSDESSKLRQADLARAGNFGQDMFPWQQALDAVNGLKEKYGKGYFAPGSKGRQEFESYFYGLSPTVARWMGVDEDKIKDYAKADKYLTQAVQSRAANFGVHSDQGLATTISGSPNVGVNDLAVDEVLKASMAVRQAEHAQTLSAAKAGPVGYSQAKSDWASTHDIRAFLLDKISDEARAKLVGSIKPGTPERDRFNRTLSEAYETGLMTRKGRGP